MAFRKASVIATAAAFVAGLAGTATASASTAAPSVSVRPNYSTCSHGGHPGVCTDILWATPLWYRSGGSIELQRGDQVEVECWYYGGTDGYFDHLVWTSRTGDVQGHVDDAPVDLNGKAPTAVVPECG